MRSARRPLSIVLSAMAKWTGVAVLGLTILGCHQPIRAQQAAAADPAPFPRVEQLLRQRCYSCHGAEKQEGGLRLDQRRRALAGGDSGRAIVPGEVTSPLLARVTASDSAERMPPEGKPLDESEVALLRAWIEQGAEWPETHGADGGASHWSFQPLTLPELPRPTSRPTWARNPIDLFVLARLEQEGVEPSPEADRATLLRRVQLDLIGLPPTPDELAAFLADDAPGAYERVVDRLLASPHYGERWGRHWLDAARYADSDGYEKDQERPHAYHFRNWVIDAFNHDLPFDRFTVEQLAGDLLPDASDESRVATGFHRNTLHNTEGGVDKEEDRTKKTVDRVNTLGAVWLGLSVGCAQCHTHKYDPITQREYYQLYAFFNSLDEVELQLGPKDQGRKAQVIAERAPRRETKIHLRGDFLQPGDAVEAAGFEVLPPIPTRGDAPRPLDRLDLATWLVARDQPLTARVTANRVWHHFFQRGLVASIDDFGAQGARPSHPALLDWLAARLRDDGWRLKDLHRLIVASSTYRQSSQERPELVERDPENEWLARQSRSRVEAEIVRDLAISVSGLLDERLGGPSVRPPQPADYSAVTYANSAKWTTSPGGDGHRRGLYTFFQRTSPYPSLMTFDAPDSNECAVRRLTSNTPLQALTLWNDVVFFECAQSLGRRIVAETPTRSGESPDALLRRRADHAVRLCMSRPASEDEARTLAVLHTRQRETLTDSDAAAIVGAATRPAGLDGPAGDRELASWILVGRVLLNLDEFVTRE